ncbi:MAG: transcriptional repressor [Actinomycetota bacterium]
MAAVKENPEIHEMVRRRLTDNEVRYTSGRRSVVTAILVATGPRSAAELAAEPTCNLPISSLYRTLSVFEEASILRKHHGSDGVARYELDEWLTGHHHHLVCVSCGLIEDIEVPDDIDQEVHEIATKIGAAAGFRVIDHVLEVEGVCVNCESES